MDNENNLIDLNIKKSIDYSDDEEKQLQVFATPTSSCKGHELYIEHILNSSHEDYFDNIDLGILQSNCNILYDNNYIPLTSKNDKLLDEVLFDNTDIENKNICNTTIIIDTDNSVGLVPSYLYNNMDKSVVGKCKYKDKNEKSSKLDNTRSTTTTTESIKSRIMNNKPVSTETAASNVKSRSSHSNDDDDSDSGGENNSNRRSSCNRNSCSDSEAETQFSTNDDGVSCSTESESEARLFLLINMMSMDLSVHDYEKYWIKCYKREKFAYTEERNYCFKQIIDEIERCLHKLDGEKHILPVNIFKNIRPVSRETKDDNDNQIFVCKRKFIKKHVSQTTIDGLKPIINKNLLFTVYYSFFTYHKFGKNMKRKISPNNFFSK